MNSKLMTNFFYWIAERHNIYQKRARGLPPPWTEDPILLEYKFTNPFRENDRTTVWMRQNWPVPSRLCAVPWGVQIFNVCFFRMFGTIEFAQRHGYQRVFNPNRTKELACKMLGHKQKVFTGAYIITNSGISAPKYEVVVDRFLTPVWEHRQELADGVTQHNSLQSFHEHLSTFEGFGGGGFMAYEVACDLNHMPPLKNADDRYTWANAGPGAKRGLNRLHDRPLTFSPRNHDWVGEMRALLERANGQLNLAYEHRIPSKDLDMRLIEHSLCEWDKYQRVLLGQGKPRSRFTPTGRLLKGPVK